MTAAISKIKKSVDATDATTIFVFFLLVVACEGDEHTPGNSSTLVLKENFN